VSAERAEGTGAMGSPRMGRVTVSEEPSSDQFGRVLVLLVLCYLLGALVSQFTWTRIVVGLMYLAVLFLTLRTAGLRQSARIGVRAGLLVGTLAVVVLLALTDSQVIRGLAALWLALVLLVTIVAVVRRILQHRVVGAETLLGAISAYVLLGLFFAALYEALDRLAGDPLLANDVEATPATPQYFSFITMTTVGYGDIVAATSAGRAVAVVEALAGQVFLVTLVARLVALLGQPPRPPA
jgi:Ion channel